MGAAFEKLFSSFFGLIWGLLRFFFGFSLFFVICFLGFFFIRYRFNPLRLRLKPLKRTYIRYKYFDLFRWLLVDFLERNKHRGVPGVWFHVLRWSPGSGQNHFYGPLFGGFEGTLSRVCHCDQLPILSL